MSLRNIVTYKTRKTVGDCSEDDTMCLSNDDKLADLTAENQSTHTTSYTQQAANGIDRGISEKTRRKRTSSGSVSILDPNADKGRTNRPVCILRNKRKVRERIYTIDFSEDTEPVQREEESAETYEEKIRKHANDEEFLSEELHVAAKNGDLSKLKVICSHLQEFRRSLLDKVMLGNVHNETALVVAIVKDNTEAAKILIDHGLPKIICHQNKTKQYEDVTPLHLAIIKNNCELVNYMLDKMDEDKRRELVHSVVKYRNFSWTSLSLAVGVGSVSIIKTLLNHEANLLQKTKDEGNTILHVLCNIAVRQPEEAKDMLFRLMSCNDEVTEWWRRNVSKSKLIKNPWPVLFRKKNLSNFTPMSYAVSLGACEFAETILELDEVYRFSQSCLGPVQTYQYDVTEIDPAVPGRDINVLSVLELYAYGGTDRMFNFGKVPPIRHVIENKWRVYRKWFVAFFLYHVLVMVAFTVSCAHFDLTPPSNGTLPEDMPKWKAPLAKCLKYFVLFSVVLYLILDIYDLLTVIVKYIIQISHKRFMKKQVRFCFRLQTDILRLVLVAFSLSVIVMNVSYAYGWDVEVFMAVALFSGWMFMFFFIRGWKNGGMFISIIRQVMSKEVFYFLLLYFIGLVASGTALRHLLITGVTNDQEDITDLLQTLYTLIKATVGLDDIMIPADAKKLWLIRIIFVVFIIFCQILMLNILIAAVNDTYQRLNEKKYQLWLQSRTKAILYIERRLPPCLRPDHGFEKLPKDDDKKVEKETDDIGDLWVLEEEDASQFIINFGVDDDYISIK